MRVSILLIAFLFYSATVFGHERQDIGFLGGASYYMGDFNPRTQFYQPSTAYGFMLRHNHNNFYTFRIQGVYCDIQADPEVDFYLPNADANVFTKTFFNLELAAEFNFLAYNTKKPADENFAPYLTLGVGVMFFDGPKLNIPMGVGVKYAIGRRWTLGAEWRIHKTFFDKMDGYTNHSQGERKSVLHNNDWLGFGGLSLAYRIKNTRAVCPAYR